MINLCRDNVASRSCNVLSITIPWHTIFLLYPCILILSLINFNTALVCVC